jgi:ATP-binding cassette subfamily B multidrug efflux pump
VQGRGRSSLVRALKYLWRFRRIASVAYLSLLVSTAAQLMVPQLVQQTIDAITGGVLASAILKLPAVAQPAVIQRLGLTAATVQGNQSGAESTLVTAGLWLVAFAAVRGVFSFLQGYLAERTSQGVAFELRNDVFARVQRLSFSYYDRTQTGQIMVRATDDVEKVRLFIGQGLMMTVGALVLLVGTLTLLFATNVQLTLAVLPTLPLAVIIFMVFGAVSQPLFIRVQQRLSALNTVLQENLAGIRVVQAFVREPYEQAKFDKAADGLLAQQLVIARTFSFLFPFVFLVANLGQAAVLYFGSRQILETTLTVGEWQKFSLYLIFVFFPLGQLGFIITQMAQAAASSTRIFEILDTKSEVANRPGAIVMPPIQGHVVFEGVTFRYFEGSDAVLRQVSLEAQPGQTVALLGATGSGKTTIINLLPRFYDVSEGRILIDGHDIRDVTLDSLRSQIGVVLQDATLFSGSIRDNICFGRPNASLEEVTAAAKAAAAHDFILGFPQGYDTPVGERGATLSGGQKQRVAIARALLLDPRILILDDSTSSVDLATEYRIQKALDSLMKGRTSFVIAQRISTVLNADQVLVLDKGEVVAHGRHADLLETSPIYAEIYNSQLMEDAALTEDDAPPGSIQGRQESSAPAGASEEGSKHV